MNENENEFDWSDSWALLALFAMAASMSNNPDNPDNPEESPMLPMRTPETMNFDETSWNTVGIDKFTIEQLRAAAMNKKEAEKLRLDMLRDAAREEEPDDYRGLYGRSWDV